MVTNSVVLFTICFCMEFWGENCKLHCLLKDYILIVHLYPSTPGMKAYWKVSIAKSIVSIVKPKPVNQLDRKCMSSAKAGLIPAKDEA